MSQRPPKKSETLEVRLPHALKTAFMACCQARGITASEAVRDEIERLVSARPSQRRFRLWPTLAAALAGLAVGAVAAPSLAQSDAGDAAAFAWLDRDGDGRLTPKDFAAR